MNEREYKFQFKEVLKINVTQPQSCAIVGGATKK